MSYSTRHYTFNGSTALADEVVHLAISNSCRVSSRASTGIFKKEHRLSVFGPDGCLDRFERQMDAAKERLK